MPTTKHKLSYKILSKLMDELYSANLPKEDFDYGFEAILRETGWTEEDFWREENARSCPG